MESDVQTGLCRGPSPAGRQPGGACTCPYTSLLASVVFSCCQSPPGEDWDGPCQGTREAGFVAVVWRLIFLSQQRQTHVTGDPSTLGGGREQSLEAQVTQSSFALFFYFY